MLARDRGRAPSGRPPGTRSRFQGFFVGPKAPDCVVFPMANSSMFVFPTTIPSSALDALDHRGVVGRHEPFEDLRSARRGHAPDADVVLDRDSDPREPPELLAAPWPSCRFPCACSMASSPATWRNAWMSLSILGILRDPRGGAFLAACLLRLNPTDRSRQRRARSHPRVFDLRRPSAPSRDALCVLGRPFRTPSGSEGATSSGLIVFASSASPAGDIPDLVDHPEVF